MGITVSHSDVVHEIVRSFHNRDLEGFNKHLHDDFTWIQKDGSVLVDGLNPFKKMISELWASNPTLKNETSECIEIGNLVSHTELFTGYADGHTEKWLWVYEFDGNLIRYMYGYQPTGIIEDI
jgi:hypothetical protein